jgi:hypothetical protein
MKHLSSRLSHWSRTHGTREKEKSSFSRFATIPPILLVVLIRVSCISWKEPCGVSHQQCYTLCCYILLLARGDVDVATLVYKENLLLASMATLSTGRGWLLVFRSRLCCPFCFLSPIFSTRSDDGYC